MKTYTCSSSKLVKIITTTSFVLFVLLAFILIFAPGNLSSASGGIFLAVILSTVFYFYTQSLIRIRLDEKFLVLKKNLGSIKLPYEEIDKVVKLKYADIPMTIGSKGFFGFIGQTMDGSRSFVKDRKQMIQIISEEKKYLISCDQRDDFLQEIGKRVKK